MSDPVVVDTLVPSPVEDLEPPANDELEQTPLQSTKDQERSCKAKYRAACKGISKELRSLQGAGIPATEKGGSMEQYGVRDRQADRNTAESKKLELMKEKETLDQKYKQEIKSLKDQQESKSKEELQEKATRRKAVLKGAASKKGNKKAALQDEPAPPQSEPVTEDPSISITTQPEPTVQEPSAPQQAVQAKKS